MNENHRIDRVPVEAAGQLFACGFSAVGQDPDKALESVEATTMVCLLTDDEVKMRYPDYVQWLNDHSSDQAESDPSESDPADQSSPHAIWLQIIDGEITDDEAVTATVRQVVSKLEDGNNVLVHCGAGMARTSVICILAMVALGAELEVAAVEFRQARPGGGPDGPAQERQIERLAELFG